MILLCYITGTIAALLVFCSLNHYYEWISEYNNDYYRFVLSAIAIAFWPATLAISIVLAILLWIGYIVYKLRFPFDNY